MMRKRCHIKCLGEMLLAAILLMTSSREVNSQDVHFSQFFEAPLWRNPSLAGIFKGDIRVQGVYRDQWNSVTDAYRTFSFNAEYKAPVGQGSDFLTTGFQLLHDQSGTIGWGTSYLMPTLNYHKSLSEYKNSYLSLGFMGGYVQHRFDISKMTTNSSYDNGGTGTGENFPSTQYGYFDGSVGMSYNGDLDKKNTHSLFVGVAYHHFTKPRQSFYHDENIQMVPKWVFSGGVKFDMSEYSMMTIQADHSRQGAHIETIGGALYGLKIGDNPEEPSFIIHGGAFLRWNDALIPVVKVEMGNSSFSVSYDANVSLLKPSSYGRGGLELSLTWAGSHKPNRYRKDLLYPGF